jgi:hypothetical protein
MVILFLTSSRSFLLMTVIAAGILFVLLLKQGRVKESRSLVGMLVAALAGTYTLAVAIGGAGVVERFRVLLESGLLESYKDNRGIFLADTFNVFLWKLRVYFPANEVRSPPIWVEVQLTGWLIDGGVLMWVLYGGALLAAMAYAYRVAVRAKRQTLGYLAVVTLVLEVMIAGTAMAGPTFNTTMGIQFWLLSGALFGAARASGFGRARASGA